ncbi:MAG: tripartite tricarboxylate transporter permease [Gammaproteobacteria bacterium]|nr:tripartite tricarboxylate transporter permease [Gammaproteobacteria bacterium]
MEFIQYFGEVFTLTNILILTFGTIGGLLLGATPGLSPTMAVALLIPFTFRMDPASSLILLGAVYTSTVAGGAVSGILVNIPGAPANIATIMDGHPMANKGRATEALQYCFISSLVGGLIGIFLLIFFTPPLAGLALKFGPAELFWISIFGITIIASIGGGSAVKGLIAGGVGLWLSTIGYNPVLGEERFVFSEHLAGGIHVIAALIGLFAIPQVLTLLENARQRKDGKLMEIRSHSIFRAIAYNLSRVKALSIGTIVGSIIGVIPGAGGQIAGLVAYDQTRKFSKNKDNFGKGEPDGVIAAESANNAMVGPSLVPLLTLGIPGSPTAAVLLGGLLINGLFPGPDLFSVHAKVTWTFIDSLLLGQIFMMVFGLSISRYSYFVTRIPNHAMAAAVTILAIFGTYSIQNSISDVIVMLALGIAMFFASRIGFSAAPLVLGLILGQLTETNFLQGRLIAGEGETVSYFFAGTINKVLILLCLASIGYSVYSEVRRNFKNRQRKQQEATA